MEKVEFATLEPAEADTKQSILEAVSSYDLKRSSAWADLVRLSEHTKFEALEANTHGVFIETPARNTFRAVADVYVILKDGHDAISESFPAEVVGKIDPVSRKASVERVDVDTSLFGE